MSFSRSSDNSTMQRGTRWTRQTHAFVLFFHTLKGVLG